MKPLVFIITWILLAGQGVAVADELSEILKGYSGTAEQNKVLWQNLQTLRQQGTQLPPDVLASFNAHRVEMVRQARLEAARKILSSGKYEAKDLAGFLNTGTWNNAAKFRLGSDVDFTAIGRNPAAVREFKQEFYQALGQKAGVPPGDVIKKLDVNCYSMGGTEPGAFRTAGGRRFFEVYSTKSGGYDAITGSGKNLSVSPSHVDNAFIDLGKSVPKFTPRDSAEFLSELRSAMTDNSRKYIGNPAAEAKANAKLVERADYAASVAMGRKAGEGTSLVLRESLALRNGMKLEEALADRISKHVAKGLPPEMALGSATREFIAESRCMVNSATGTVVKASLQNEGAAFAKFREGLAGLSSNKTAVLFRTAGGLLTLHALYTSYQEGGKPALAREIARQGCFHLFPPTALADLAAVGIKISGDAFLSYVNGALSEGVLRDMFGKTPAEMIAFAKAHPNPAEFRKFFEREWNEQYAGGKLFENKGWSDEKAKGIVLEEAEGLLNRIYFAIADQRTKQKELLQKMLDEARREKAEIEKENQEDPSLQPEADESDKEVNLAVAAVDKDAAAKAGTKLPELATNDDADATDKTERDKTKDKSTEDPLTGDQTDQTATTKTPRDKPSKSGKQDAAQTPPTESELIRAEADRILTTCGREITTVTNRIMALGSNPGATVEALSATKAAIEAQNKILQETFRKYLAQFDALEERCTLQEDLDYVESKAASIRSSLAGGKDSKPPRKRVADGEGTVKHADGSWEKVTYESDGKGGTRPVITYYDKSGKIIRVTR